MGLRFHDWIDYNGVTFLVELLKWGRTFSGFLGQNFLLNNRSLLSPPAVRQKYHPMNNGEWRYVCKYLWLSNVPECLYCRWKVKCSTFNLTNLSIHLTITYVKGRGIIRKWLSWDSDNDICSKVTKMGSMISHRIDYYGVGVRRGQRQIPAPPPLPCTFQRNIIPMQWLWREAEWNSAWQEC